MKESINTHLPTTQDYALVYKSKKLENHETVEMAGIQNSDELKIEYFPIKEFPTKDMLPIITKFRSFPSLFDMENMTVTELKKIENFALENEYGKIVFEGETNVLKLNVDECISIENKNICGFPGIDEKDKVYKDQRLNKPATVTLYNFKPSSNKGKVEIKLRISCEENNTDYISFNEENGEFVFKIKNL